MAVENLVDSLVLTGLAAVPVTLAEPSLAGGVLRRACFKVEMTAAASDTSTYRIARLPSSCRLSDLSYISFDDLASAGSPTLDIGVQLASGRTDTSALTADPDAINDGLDAATATRGAKLIKTIDNVDKQLWEHAGASSDPGGDLDVYISLVDADANTGGTIQGEIFYCCN